jgi:hypothetical protein
MDLPIFWPYLTSSGWNWPSNNKICSILESTSNLQPEKEPYQYLGQLQILTFVWEFSIFKASELPTDLKKKYADMSLICSYNFLRFRRDQFLPNCRKPTLIYSLMRVFKNFQKIQKCWINFRKTLEKKVLECSRNFEKSLNSFKIYKRSKSLRKAQKNSTKKLQEVSNP